jgi:hypothetical protein
MAQLTNEQRRALRILSRHPDGCAEANMLAHGFKVDQIARLVLDGLARADQHEVPDGGRRINVVWVRITVAGRKAIAE